MKLLVKVRYDGSAYCGFQAQPNGPTVQGILTEAFSHLFAFPCDVTGCSRTDSGVHALGFCATVVPHEMPPDHWCTIPVSRLHRAVNALLPDDIAVVGAAAVPDSFHPRYDVISKEYEYRILNTPARDPFYRGRAHHVPRPIPVDGEKRMQEAAALFVGENNFSAYMATGSKIKDPVRHVYSAAVERISPNVLVYRVRANGFLYNMVRIMAGTLLECAHGNRDVSAVERSLLSGKREDAGFTAPPEGLYLTDVRYAQEIHWLCE